METTEDRPKVSLEGSSKGEEESPKKRRKVNHACIYCRRSHMTCDLQRPCQRCVKRSIGHLCHDEPRDPHKGHKSDSERAEATYEPQYKRDFQQSDAARSSVDDISISLQYVPGAGSHAPAGPRDRVVGPQSLRPTSNPVRDGEVDVNKQFNGYRHWDNRGQLQEMQNFPSYMFNAPDITDEYNVLNDFLNSSLLDDDNTLLGGDTGGGSSEILQTPSNATTMSTGEVSSTTADAETDTRQITKPPLDEECTSGPKGVRPEKEDEKLYMRIADPSGNDTPQERMTKLLQAKYNAGMLKPFNYVQGYARLGKYMESHMQPASRQRILKQLERFRPKFREKMQPLTDMQLTFVEMWFERTLMEYDRVFASMAIPSCCWRRTGEIFRGNREMAELIHVPIDKLRDGRIAIHEIIAEKDLVNYWDSFLAIAFDNSQKAMLTTCSLKNPDETAVDPEIKCCFSFTIRRDAQHNIPSLIVGNFIPQMPRKV